MNRFKLRFSPCYPYGEAEDVSICMPEPGLSSEAGDLQLPALAAAPRTIAQWIKAPPGQWEKEGEHLRS